MRRFLKCVAAAFFDVEIRGRLQWAHTLWLSTEVLSPSLSVFVLHYISAANYKYQQSQRQPTEPHRQTDTVRNKQITPSNLKTLRRATFTPRMYFFSRLPPEYLITTGLALINYYTGISCNCFSWDKQRLWIELDKFSWVLLTGSSKFRPFLFCKWLSLWGRMRNRLYLFKIKLGVKWQILCLKKGVQIVWAGIGVNKTTRQWDLEFL